MEDKRVPCKYGAACYQTNELHHQKYKHEKKVAAERNIAATLTTDDGPSPGKKARINEVQSTSQDKSPSSQPVVDKHTLKQMFLVEMPEEFFSFWDFCKSLHSNNPKDALAICGLFLVGPFNAFVNNNLKDAAPDQLLRYWRYYYDPPEFQTLIRGDEKSQYHMGYFRDSPDELPVFVASNCAAENCIFKPLAPNLFAAVDGYLTNQVKSSNPFQQLKLKKLQSALHTWAKQHNITLGDGKRKTSRSKNVVCKSFHKAGLVTPYNRSTTIGYRNIETDERLRELLDAIAEAKTPERRDKETEELDLLITNASIANDEHDFGGALELGMNLFCHGAPDFHAPALGILRSTYSLLGRHAFTRILEAHLKDRKKGTDLGL